MFKKILIPLDGSSLAECVLSHAVSLSLANHSQIHLLRVMNPVSSEVRISSGDPFEWNFRKVEAETYLKNISLKFVDLGVETHVLTAEGKTADTIIEYAHNQGIDLILISSHGKSGLTGWNVSSVVQKVIFRAHTSIMIIRAYQPVQVEPFCYGRILLPLDGSQRAESVLQIAIELSRFWKAELLVAHVIARPQMPRWKPLSQEEIQLAEKIVECNRVEATQYLAELKHRFALQLETHLFVSDKVASSLHRFVKDQDVDLVVLTAHGFSGETAWPYGSMVFTFIAYGSSPLLIYQDMSTENIQLNPAEEATKERGDH